jgi:glycosyltransferase involved in cell wall biosynthesis
MRQIRHKYGLEKDYILFVGTVQPRKNLVRLIEAFAKLDSNQQLVIAGKLGWMYDEILAAPKKLNVSNRVRLVGRVEDPDMAAIYKGASLFILPSLMEGFGLPILEAMNFGVPVITSDRGALPEVAGKAALVVNPESSQQMAEAMNLVLTNQELKQGLIEAGYRRISQFSWAKAARETLAILTEKW